MKKIIICLMTMISIFMITGCSQSNDKKLCKSLDQKLISTNNNLIGTTELGGEVIKPDVIQTESDNAKAYLQEAYNNYCTNSDSEICNEINDVIKGFDMFPATSKYGAARLGDNITMLSIDCDKILNKKH